MEATPIVVDGVMYTTGPFSIVYALDARTGKEIWKYDPKSDRSRAGEACCDAINRGVAVWKGKVYVGVLDGRLEAIDAKTGERVWSVDTRYDKERSYSITGAPRVVNGKVVIGNGGAEFGVRGYVTAYDAETGKQAGASSPSPATRTSRPKARAWRSPRRHGMAARSSSRAAAEPPGTPSPTTRAEPALHRCRQRLAVGSDLAQRGKGDNLFLSSIVAVNADTGEYVWHYQTTPGDAWDYTATQHMILADLQIDGKQRKV